MNMPPRAPAMPPMPTTELTALRGTVSEASVNRLAEKPWCAAAARPINRTADHRLVTLEAKMIGTTATAHINIAVLRPALTVQPCRINREETQPPPILPMLAMV